METAPNLEVGGSLEDKVVVYRPLTQVTKAVNQAVNQAVNYTSPNTNVSMKAIATPSFRPEEPMINDKRNAEEGF